MKKLIYYLSIRYLWRKLNYRFAHKLTRVAGRNYFMNHIMWINENTHAQGRV